MSAQVAKPTTVFCKSSAVQLVVRLVCSRCWCLRSLARNVHLLRSRVKATTPITIGRKIQGEIEMLTGKSLIILLWCQILNTGWVLISSPLRAYAPRCATMAAFGISTICQPKFAQSTGRAQSLKSFCFNRMWRLACVNRLRCILSSVRRKSDGTSFPFTSPAPHTVF